MSRRFATLALLGAILLPIAAAHAAADSLPHYEIDARIQPEAGALTATVSITLPASPLGTEYRFLLGRSYLISGLSGDGASVSATEVDKPIPKMREILVRTTRTAGARVRIEYGGPLFALATPSINTISPGLVELSIDSFWLPYSANLGSPFTATALIRGLPDSAVAVANVPSRRANDGLHLDAVEPTFDLAFVAAPGLQIRDDGRFRIVATDLESPMAKYFGAHGSASVGYLEKWLGPMPGKTATVTVVRRLLRSGYARPGYVVVTETPTATPAPGQAKFIAHEFSHIWFSRASPIGEDYWLVETPAEYLGLRYVEDALGADALESLLEPMRARAATAPSLLGNGRGNDAAIYAKGPLLLFELEKRIGRPAVDQIFRELAAEPRHTTALFLATLRKVGGDAAAREFEAKLRS